MTNMEKILYILECIANDAGNPGVEGIFMEIIEQDGKGNVFDIYEDVKELIEYVEGELQ